MNQCLLAELIAMKTCDLDTRSTLAREGRLYGQYAEEMQRVHRENAHRLDELVSSFGWPTVALVGLEGSRAAWLIAQHANCTPDLQRRFLAQLSAAAERGEVPKPQVAFLTDRVRFNENKPQVYGTILDWDASGELSCVVEEPVNLDARRKEVGLPLTSEDDLVAYRKEVEAEGGKPPRDFTEYKRRAAEFAKSVGWFEPTQMLHLVINVDVDDLDEAVVFYTAALGLRLGRRLFDGTVAEMLGASSTIHLLLKPAGRGAIPDTTQSRSYARHWTPVHLDIQVADVAAAVERAVHAGAKLEGEVQVFTWGHLATMSDPFGHGFCLLQLSPTGYDHVA